MTIPSGYQLRVTSWTNDGDHYNTTTHSGLTSDDVKFLLKVLQPFKSRHNGGVFGNDDSCGSAIEECIFECWQEHPTKESSQFAEWMEAMCEDSLDGLTDLAYDLVGYDEYCGWRVFENATVFYFENAVADVTSQFN
jgi:hypothetical protein